MNTTIKLIVPKDERLNAYMIHRMLCFGFDRAKGNDSIKMTTTIKVEGSLYEVISQVQNNTSVLASASADVMRHYLFSEYDEYDDEVWKELNDGGYEVIELEVSWVLSRLHKIG